MSINSTSSETQNKAVTPHRVSTGSVTSSDGTIIGFRQLGHGPGLVVLHGAISSGYTHIQLAEALTDAFTVHLVDRRGRGLSGPYGKNSAIQEEVEDLSAILSKTDSHYIFGVSSGAIIALQAALILLPIIQKVAIYEPPLLVKDPVSVLARFDAEMSQGRVAAALVTAMLGAQMGPRIFNILPRWLLEPLTNLMLSGEAKNPRAEYIPMLQLAPTLHFDSQLIVEMCDKLESYRALHTRVLLLGGSKSPAYLKAGLDALEKILPESKRIQFPGLGHAASWNKDIGGRSEPVAQALRGFFA
jgi:pimeloyl-ACP methyl ester carboxylesterase